MPDLVHFKLRDAKRETALAASISFGLPLGQVYDALQQEATIVCRAEQFARFIIRCGRSGFDAQLVTHNPGPIDVSANL